jgi:A/G-specific adenine glycosylase
LFPVKKLPLPQHAKEFAQALAKWFGTAARDYPWRRTHDPYAILVSEIMLQQTQIATVLERGFYARWMEQFPDFATLADAHEQKVLKAWEGLGYYRRARHLHKLAREVMEEHAGAFPQDVGKIESLPGIGRYTAGAVASFAFNQRVPIVDGNVARVLSRLYNDPTPVDSTEGIKRSWDRAMALLATAPTPRSHNAALMELGQTICRPGIPNCAACPVRSFCSAHEPARLPVKGKVIAMTELTERTLFHGTEEGVLLEQEAGGRRTGMWKLPELPDSSDLPAVLHRSRYTITRYRVTLWVHAAPEKRWMRPLLKLPRIRFIPEDQLPHVPMPSPHRRALEAVMKLRAFRLE